MNERILCIFLPLLMSSMVSGRPSIHITDDFVNEEPNVNVNQPEDWYKLGEQELQATLAYKSMISTAKNVIIFIGDGMGMPTITAARVQREQNGEKDPRLSFEKFPNVAISKTYDADYTVPDSAATATAILTGTKTNHGTIGVNQKAVRGKCASIKGNEVESILDLSLRKGKAVGVVTTARLTHATPAASYAHVPERNWESDVTDDVGGCKDIAHQLIYNNTNIQVLLGGGRTNFYPNDTADVEYPGTLGRRMDNISLVDEWKKDKERRKLANKYVWNLDEFNSVDATKTDYLLGLFEPSHMQYEIERNKTMEPSLTEMVEKSIKILQRNKNGYFLEVEAGRIDHAHHDSFAKKAIWDTIELSRAVQKALDLVNQKDTLIIVTADHSHVFTLGGYAPRQVPILGKAKDLALDNMPYTALAYSNGPGYSINSTTGKREDLTNVDTTHKDYRQHSAVPLKYETHGGEDVAIYATGPMSYLFRGVHEQNYIAHVMTYASCVGDVKRAHCGSAVSTSMSLFTLISVMLLRQLIW